MPAEPFHGQEPCAGLGQRTGRPCRCSPRNTDRAHEHTGRLRSLGPFAEYHYSRTNHISKQTVSASFLPNAMILTVSCVVVPGYRLSLGVASQQGQTFCLQDLELVTAWCVLQGPVHAENNLEITNSLKIVCKRANSDHYTTYRSKVSLLKSNRCQSLILKDGFRIF